tara:strand:+ start:20 stop:355 length:336 start_codon:yes stop_codon:yes gene_type:complete
MEYPTYNEIENVVFDKNQLFKEHIEHFSEYNEHTHNVIIELFKSNPVPSLIDFKPVAESVDNFTALQGVFYIIVSVLRMWVSKSKILTHEQGIEIREKIKRDFEGYYGWSN